MTSDDGAPKADAVARDSADDDDNNDAGADDDDDVSDVDLDDAWVYDEEDLHRAFEGLRALTKAGLRHSLIMRIIKDQCSLWQPGDSRTCSIHSRHGIDLNPLSYAHVAHMHGVKRHTAPVFFVSLPLSSTLSFA